MSPRVWNCGARPQGLPSSTRPSVKPLFTGESTPVHSGCGSGPFVSNAVVSDIVTAKSSRTTLTSSEVNLPQLHTEETRT